MNDNNDPTRLANIHGYTYFDHEYEKLFVPDHPHCALLWSSMSNEPGGTVRPCCIATDRLRDGREIDYNLSTTNPLEILQSEEMSRLRNQFRNYEKPAMCNTCWVDEDNGKKSKRQQYNEYYTQWYGSDSIPWIEEHTDHIRLVDLQLIFGNTCNLKCRSCNANYSSKWVEEADERKIPYWETNAEIDMNDISRSKFWTEFDVWTRDLRRLEIMGGEPFYVKQFKTFVDQLINKNRAKDISLSLSTNGTIADEDFLDKIVSNFKQVSFSVSIDGINDRFEYLRHPAKWDAVKENLDLFYKLHNSDYPVTVQITHTVTALNVMYLPEFHDYFKEHFPNFKIWNNLAHYPKWIAVNALPEKAKNVITTALTNHEFVNKPEIVSIINHMNTPLYYDGSSVDDSLRDKFKKEKLEFFDMRNIEKKWEIFKYQIVGGDIYRQETFKETFPELHDLISDSFDYDSIKQEVSEKGYPHYSTRELIQ